VRSEEFKEQPASNEPDPPRRAMPSPLDSPPFPSSEYQGYPLIGVPYNTKEWPLQKALEGTWLGDLLKKNRIYTYGWVTAAGNWSSSKNSNLPESYWLVPNEPFLDQVIFRIERPVDVQTDHIDVGFRSTFLYGGDYRFITAGGWLSEQLLHHDQLYGFIDPRGRDLDNWWGIRVCCPPRAFSIRSVSYMMLTQPVTSRDSNSARILVPCKLPPAERGRFSFKN
jgi:hypothetical protein